MASSRPSNDGSHGFAAVDLSESGGPEADSWPVPVYSEFAQGQSPTQGRRTTDQCKSGRYPLQASQQSSTTQSQRARFDVNDDEDDDEDAYFDDAYMDDMNMDMSQKGLLGGLRHRAKRRMKHWVRKPWFLMCGLALVLGLIILSSVASNGPAFVKEPQHISLLPNVTLEHFFNGTFSPRTSNYRWLPGADGFHAFLRQKSIVVQHALDVKNESVILQDLKEPNGEPITIQDFFISPDMRYVLVETDYERGWRHSFLANYWLWDVNKKEATRLPTSEPTKKLALVMWSKSGNNIAWVRENNIYVTLNADPHIEVPITNDGSANIINGIADWVYEEEVFGSHEAMWFSPDGTHVAYLKFNETEVPEYNLQYYERNKQNSYPEGVSVKYPKPGYPNPVVTLHIATPGATNPAGWDNLVELDPLHYFPDNDRLFVEVTWVTDNSLLVRTTNRVQDTHRLFLVKAVTANDTTRWRGTLVRNQTTTDGGWITKLQPLTFIPPALAIGRNQPSYVELLEDADGYMHIAHFQSVNSVDPAWLTKGAWEVEKILAVDAQRGLIYYSSTEDGPTQRHIFSVALDGTKERLTPPKGELPESPVVPSNILAGREAGIALDASGADAGFYSARFSPGCGFYVLQYEGPGVPWSRIYKADLSEFRTDVDNKELWNVIGQYAVPQIQYFQIPIAHQSEKPGDTSSSSEARQSPQMMNAMLRGPHDFNANGTTKYPVLMRVYGGPNSQLVQQRFSVDFMTAVVSAGGFLSLTVDGRGTGLMGRKFRTAVASHLGSVEVDDQLAAADWLRTQSFVDPARIAIWGWSYGGYMTAKCIEANSGRFALGMSVAPVTDWMYYDSIYTERYMKTPRSNPKGYEGSAVTEMEGFRNAKYLLVHGTADDNVHFQNTASLIWKLTNARIRNYQVQVYTDSDHSMSAGGAPREVYVRLWNFLMENLQGEQYRLAR